LTARLFPIMPPWNLKARAEQQQGVPAIVLNIPWELIAPHEAQAIRNHGQSLETLARRGGLMADEAIAVIEHRAWSQMPRAESNRRLLELMSTPSLDLERLDDAEFANSPSWNKAIAERRA
jgi:hypothetical protein